MIITYKGFKECITHRKAILKQNQTEVLKMNTTQQIKNSMERLTNKKREKKQFQSCKNPHTKILKESEN